LQQKILIILTKKIIQLIEGKMKKKIRNNIKNNVLLPPKVKLLKTPTLPKKRNAKKRFFFLL
jgi:hypothetical protein